MIITRSTLRNHRFKKIKMHEDYLFKCEVLKIITSQINLMKLQHFIEF